MTYKSREDVEFPHYICDACDRAIVEGEEYTRTADGEVKMENGRPDTNDKLLGDIYHADCYDGGQDDV